MKDLILVGAYCPDDYRERLLSNFLDCLQTVRERYDILVCSHTIIPSYIVKKCDYVFYDKNNDVINDMEYLNQPWFRPVKGLTILSTNITGRSTYLSVYRVLISGLSIAKTYQYKKVHYIEYDTYMDDFSDLDENSKLLNEYDNIIIKKRQPEAWEDGEQKDIIHPWGLGFFMSLKLDKLDNTFLEFNRDKLLELLKNSPNKTNEKITEEILKLNNRKFYIKDYDEITSKTNRYNLSNFVKHNQVYGWFVPYYNTQEDKVSVIVWNNSSDMPMNIAFIINNKEILYFNNLNKTEWSIRDVGKIEDINSIITIVNGVQKDEIVFDEETRELFKKTNYTKHDI